MFIGGSTPGSLASPNAGASDAWLARYNRAGNQLWIRQFGSGATDSILAATQDGVGGVYTTGSTLGSLGSPNAGNHDVWLARYDFAGNRAWLRQFGTALQDVAYACAHDGSSGSYVAGLTFGSLGGPYFGGSGDAWLARYDGAGNQLWIRQLGTSSSDVAYTAAPDGSGGVYLGGATTGSLGGANAGWEDAWLARYDGAGNQVWIRQLGTSGQDSTSAASPDGSGGVYVSGFTVGSLGGVYAGASDAWLARYNSSGNVLWIRQLGSSYGESARFAMSDGSGGVYIGGYTKGDLGGPNAGDYDAWLARYDGVGIKLWVLQFGTKGIDYANLVAPYGSSGLYVGGTTTGSFGKPNTAGSFDAWLARYDDYCGVNLNYCTSKTNSLNCMPSIATSGTPSASAGSRFSISAANVLHKQFGLFLYSKSGPASTPFQGGTLCVMPPHVRTPVQDSGGALPCDGSFLIDFNAYVASGADPALVAGQRVWIQSWSRDPGFAPPNNSSLSDAVSFTLCP
jgi:hypothetical protein